VRVEVAVVPDARNTLDGAGLAVRPVLGDTDVESCMVSAKLYGLTRLMVVVEGEPVLTGPREVGLAKMAKSGRLPKKPV
jgi:hypothetical protein